MREDVATAEAPACLHDNDGLAADRAAIRPGRYLAVAEQMQMELRVADPDSALVSGDLFRVDSAAQRTWVASFRSSRPLAEQTPIMAQDRYGAAATGWVRLAPVTESAAQAVLYLEGRLDGLPLRREIALTAEFVGNALRSIALEVEVEEDVLGPPSTTFNDTAMTIEAALASASIEVRSGGINNSLPPAPEGGWSEKDIEELSRQYAQIDMANQGFALQMLWLSRSNRSGLYGIMFDTKDERPRQSLAVFASEIRDNLGDDAPVRDRKLIQTAVHEIGHALNLAHRFEREVGRADSTSFMNYDWRYLGGDHKAEFWQQFAYRFDADEIGFLCHAPYSAIVMGGAKFHSARYWNEGNGGFSPYVPERPLPGIVLSLTAGRNGFFRFAEPVLLSLSLRNQTGQPLRVPATILDPKAGFIELLVRRIARGQVSDAAPQSFQPIVTRCFEIGENQTATIPDGGHLDDNVNLTFGASGFMFAEPGTYEVQALLVVGGREGTSQVERITRSEKMQITIGYPEGRSDYQLADEIFQADVGRWFALGAPARLNPVGDRLVDLTRRKGAMPKEIAAHVLRTGMFGANRAALRFEAGKLVRSDADRNRFAELAGALRAAGLDAFDPVTRAQTQRYLEENLG